jgi:tetratricopeptide (TPR) repeat protein
LLSERAALPPELDPVFQRALAKDPAERFGSSAELVGALRSALDQAAGTTRRIAAMPEERGHAAPAPAAASRPVPLVWIGAALLALFGLAAGLAMAGILGGDDEPGTRTIVQTLVSTKEGRPTTVRETVTTAPATTAKPTTATTATTAPSDESGEQLTDRATALLGEGDWAGAEAASRQALAKLEGSGELYEAYANYNLGRALVEQGRCEEALPHLDESAQIQGSRREIREARARCRGG